jgi:hypothetical protein
MVRRANDSAPDRRFHDERLWQVVGTQLVERTHHPVWQTKMAQGDEKNSGESGYPNPLVRRAIDSAFSGDSNPMVRRAIDSAVPRHFHEAHLHSIGQVVSTSASFSHSHTLKGTWIDRIRSRVDVDPATLSMENDVEGQRRMAALCARCIPRSKAVEGRCRCTWRLAMVNGQPVSTSSAVVAVGEKCLQHGKTAELLFVSKGAQLFLSLPAPPPVLVWQPEMVLEPEQPAEPQKKGKWDADEKSAFDDALEIHGEDFEVIARYARERADERQKGARGCAPCHCTALTLSSSAGSRRGTPISARRSTRPT